MGQLSLSHEACKPRVHQLDRDSDRLAVEDALPCSRWTGRNQLGRHRLGRASESVDWSP
ncbi:hypothetical protein OG709_00255 [Streptomyces sp. NBC_01267]|uniref:hypothetical protein n=1 Tax=Streptomyces sp. NBC_01267 TaxID=2903805 RepID=UPI002E326BC3|nr:hypothetical protein [Streptomyces sp. NBC_01267]